MQGLLIANKNQGSREQLASLFNASDYQVTTVDAVANALEGIINKDIQVVVIDGHYDEQNIVKLIPLLKKCNRNISIILVSDEMPIEMERRIRKEGIFYHALKTVGEDNGEEIRQVVSYAFKKYAENTAIKANKKHKAKAMFPVKSALSTIAMIMMFVSPAFAVDTTQTYNSGILVLLLIGFCALLIVAQLVPAVLVLVGMTKAAVQRTSPRAQKSSSK
ncbi:Response regulator receiver domain-containing protein [Desulfuromusa kysingii]|uniref:Response regulator receiver domain-containing protein n=1 Tax=Desulfuromusa kysingii TaxID=37625 RepID=A0A1H3XEC0_9BACT|nr:response regulator [Desulfuromusa kysingii]SDZ97689.1 Response regulator receiver domain-containing protein [Desulfuromusa kysingii]